jgi:predicted RND superfamily exporter protein
VTILSDLPSLRLFGRLAGLCLIVSLIGQLVILPATIALYRRYFPRQAETPASPGPASRAAG